MIKKNGKLGLYSKTGKRIISCEYDDIKYQNGDFIIIKGNQKGICKGNGKKIIPCEFDDIKVINNSWVATHNGKMTLYKR